MPSRDMVCHYPDLAPLRAALRAEDWPAVIAFFDGLPERQDPTVATYLVAETKGVERFLRVASGGSASSTLAGSLLGARLIVMAWDARGAARARRTSRREFRSFHQILVEAEQVLSEVTAEDPDNVAAWTSRLKAARGLGLGQQEASRRYERAVKARTHPFLAQLSHVQQLCPKWGGSLERMHAFARECADNAPPGSLNAAAVAEAHLEHFFHERDFRYLRRPAVLQDVKDAVARSVGHPDYRPVHGWVQAQSSFAYVLWHAGDRWGADARMAALGNRITQYPWSHIEFWSARRSLSRGIAR
ncbi:hypothetical protein [Catellatospora paridis]|uniref:hypothetical protein n=1 Tax=Catellatospora paridis TaxID=1617086 RepID=UPI0012D3BB72|nr:hypothetical protein [Catellatospora paridis]